MTVAANALFLASSCLDLIAIGAGMLGFEAASSVLGVVGIVTVLAGFILVMIEITKKKPTPIESFAKNRAAGMGFYMPYGYDIDSFKVIPPSGSIPSRSGAAFYVGSTDHSLVMNADGTVSLGKYDGKASTSLGLDVDAEGNLRVYAILEDTEGQSVALYLTPVSYTHLDVYKRQSRNLSHHVPDVCGIRRAEDKF